ncbi:MAG: hypothetical protein JW891_11275 [Candidatus Lokiarchaeota archaeon]|nr:hypothetical protein [Candidatus Lokiarchaeota archaeon]
MFKRSKKDMSVNIDDKTGQLYLGNKDLRLLMLRPIDLIEFGEFSGSSADDILIWVGKSVGKGVSASLIPEVAWTNETLSTKKQAILGILDTMEQLGYGVLEAVFNKNNVEISVKEPLSTPEKENIMAKNICRIYQGLFHGMFENMQIDVDSEEIRCILLDQEACVFKYTLVSEEFDDNDIEVGSASKEKDIDSLLKSI